MGKRVLFAVLFFAACAVPSGAEKIDMASLLQDVYDLGTLPIITDSTCRQFSSYDRSGGNADAGNFLSRSEDGTVLLAEMKGPGAIVRIWSANPAGFLKIFLDDATEPVIAMPFQEFFKDPNYQPIRTTSSGGWISYYPIPYAKSCKVIVEKAPGFYYHVTYQTYGPGTEVKTYTAQLEPAAQKQLDQALKVWRSPANAPTTERKDALGPVSETFRGQQDAYLEPGATKPIFSASGPGCLDFLVLGVSSQSARQLKQLVIRAYWDGEKSPSIEAPFLDFFGSGFQKVPYQALPIGIQPGGGFYCRFPMPYSKSARIEVENGSQEPVALSVGYSGRRLKSLKPDAGRFHAKWRREITEAGRPYLILQAEGRGRYVGTALSMQGLGGLGFLEGDELIYVDGEKDPSFNGTGTEDYFNCGWYFAEGPVSQPMHGAIVRDDGASRVSAYRFHIPDHIDYQKQLTVKIEHGAVSDYPGAEYSSVAYFYQIEPHHEFFTMPAAKNLALPRRTIPPTAPGAIEVETLAVSAQDGKVSTKAWEDVSPELRGGKLVVFIPDTPQASLTVPFNVEVEDKYALTLSLAGGTGFGPVVAEIDGEKFPQLDVPTRGDPAPAAPISAGEKVLKPGEHVLKLTPVGVANGRPLIGLDRIALVSRSRFIRSWSIIGPFDNTDWKGFDTPYPPETESINMSKTYVGKSGKEVGWKEIQANSDMVDLAAMMQPNEAAVAYALTYVISPDERKVDLLIGSDDSVKVWLNGEQVWRNQVQRAALPDQDKVSVTLKPGVNTLLLKIAQGGGAWGFVARFRDPLGTLKYTSKKPED